MTASARNMRKKSKWNRKLCWILSGLLLALGAVVMNLPGFRFAIVPFGGAAALLAAYALLDRWSEEKRTGKICKVIFLVCVVAGMIFFAILELWVVSWSHTDSDTPVEAVVVLGAGVNGTEPSYSLRVRLEAALAYIQDRPDIPVVVSGGRGRGEEISEARCMADWLIARGVEAERVLLEDQATNTEENIRFSKEILSDKGIYLTDNVAVVTSDFHLCRAAWLWGDGMVPVAASMSGGFFPLTVHYYIREAFAMAGTIVFS